MNTGKAPACVPTWRGHVETTKDALLIFEACFSGTLAHCFRRPHDRERNHLIVSGNVFVYEEATSGIKRWTDGIPWSPSRILTNFLIYRQLNNPFPPGEKKRATKRGQRPTKPGDPYPAPGSSKGTGGDESYRVSPVSPSTPGLKPEESLDKDANRGLLGSLVDSYEFKENGLLKKTMTVVINNVQHHLVSYYSVEDAKHSLHTPREDPRLRDITLRDDLLHQSKFKFPNFDDAGDGTLDALDGGPNAYAYYHSGYDHSRQLSIGSRGHSSHLESPSMYYSGMSHYTSQSQTPTGLVSYASLPPTSSAYIPMPPAATTYSQHYPPQQEAQEHAHGAASQSAHHQVQSLPHSHPELQHHPTHGLHQGQAFQQHLSPLSPPNPSHHGSTHQVSYPESSAQALNFPPQLTPGLPRPTPNYDYLTSHADNLSSLHDYYSTPLGGAASLNEPHVMLPMPWNGVAQPFQSRATTAPSSQYRATN